MNNCHNCKFLTGKDMSLTNGLLAYECSREPKVGDGWIRECDLDAKCSYWKPRQQEKVKLEQKEKEYTSGQMIDMLLENPERKAKSKHLIVFTKDNYLRMNNTTLGNDHIAEYPITEHSWHRKWQIIEPQPQVELWEAFRAVLKTNTKVKSCVTGKEYAYLESMHIATEEELRGKWLIIN